MSSQGDIVTVRQFAMVSSSSVSTKDTIPPNGEVWEIIEVVGGATHDGKTFVHLCWEYGLPTQDCAVNTYGDVHFNPKFQLTGNGSKKLTIVLENEDSVSHLLGLQFTYKVLSVPS